MSLPTKEKYEELKEKRKQEQEKRREQERLVRQCTELLTAFINKRRYIFILHIFPCSTGSTGNPEEETGV